MIYFISDSNLIIHINGKEVAFSEIDLNLNVYDIKTIEDLQCFLNSFNKIKCCIGLDCSTQLYKKTSLFSQNIVASNGNWKHTNCLTVLKDYDG